MLYIVIKLHGYHYAAKTEAAARTGRKVAAMEEIASNL
jgi:hypothetical protein